MEGNPTSVIEPSDVDIKKLCCSGKYKKVTKIHCQYVFEGGESHEEIFNI